MTLWRWLGNNSAQVEALAGIAGVIVACIVGWVAWKQKLAAEAQAQAAKKQTIAAETQAEAAMQQVAAAKQQIATSLLIADKQAAPHIVFTAARLQGAIIRNSIEFQNGGSGAALNLSVTYRDNLPGYDDLRTPKKMLVAGDAISIVIEESRAARSGLRVSYETLFGTKYALEFQWNGHVGQAVNQDLHIVHG